MSKAIVYVVVQILDKYPTTKEQEINVYKERHKKDETEEKNEETDCKINVPMQDIMAGPTLRCIGRAMRVTLSRNIICNDAL